VEVEHASVRFLGNLVLNLWDCGGQESFMENYFTSQRDHIFRNVEVLIYVFDVESREIDRDFQYFHSCMDAIKQNSKDAKVFCLVHKMDLVQEELRERVCCGLKEIHILYSRSIPGIHIQRDELDLFALLAHEDCISAML
jgi:Ras-related GTP-binding protein A/B